MFVFSQNLEVDRTNPDTTNIQELFRRTFVLLMHAVVPFLPGIACPIGKKCNSKKDNYISTEMNSTSSSVTPSAKAPSLSFAELLARKGDAVVATKGLIIKGTYDRSGLVSYGGKSDGILTPHDRENCDLQDGEETEFFVVVGEDEDEQGCLAQLSYFKARSVRRVQGVWKTAGELVESKGTVTVEVKALAKRKSDGNVVGLRALFDGVEGFIPKSMLGPVGSIENLVGKPLDVKIAKADAAEKDLMFSRKAVLEETAEANKESARDYIAQLKVGQVLTGTVCNTKPFGTFVKIGPVEGLVHISELPTGSWIKPEIGGEIEVEVVGVNQAQGKVSLSVARPGKRSFVARHAGSVGEAFTGRVQNLINCAAFVEIEPGYCGFLHFSEVDATFEAARKKLAVGTVVEVRVKDVDVQKERLGLSFVRAGSLVE